MRKNKKAAIANLFEIIGASLFLVVLFFVFCSGLFIDFNRVNVMIESNTEGYAYDITMQNYLRAPVKYENATATMLDLINIAIGRGDQSYLEQKTKELLVQYVYEGKFWYVGVWDMQPQDLDEVLNKYVDYDDFEDLMEEDAGLEIGDSELLINMHQLLPEDKGENNGLRFTQIPYFSSREKKFLILVFQVGDAK